MTFVIAISLDLDQTRHMVGPDLDPNCLTLFSVTVFLNEFFEEVNLMLQKTHKQHYKQERGQRSGINSKGNIKNTQNYLAYRKLKTQK